MRTPLRTCALSACAMLLSAVAIADEQAAAPVELHIEAQPLDAALNAWADQTGYSVLVPFERAAQGRMGAQVQGTYTPEEALRMLLATTDLHYEFVNRRTVAIRAAKQAENSAKTTTSAVYSTDAMVRLAQADSSADSPPSSSGSATSATVTTETHEAANGEVLSEIVVTAQKREERLQDVPVPVTAIDARSLSYNNQLRLQDYYTQVPGLSFTSSGSGDVKLSIRGITNGSAFSNPTVGIMVDDAPYGSTTVLGGFRVAAPDIDPSDLQRVEVLRGPQGTLYGASSIGGLLKFVTTDPSTAAVAGRVQVGVNSVRNGDDAGYNVRGAVNLPLGDTVALRASGFTRRDPGYLDIPALNLAGVNKTEVQGGRVSALWKPSEAWSLKLSALFQDTSADGTGDATRGLGAGDLEQVRTVRGAGYFDHDVRSLTATLKVALGGAELVSISGYGVDEYDGAPDLSDFYATQAADIHGVAGAMLSAIFKTSKFTQEIRLSASRGRFDWLAGLFYTHEDSPNSQTIFAVDPATAEIAGLLLEDPFPTTYDERAVFADLTFHVTDRFDIQLGGRESENKQAYEESLSGPLWASFGLPDPSINPPVHTKDSSFTYLLTPSFKLSSALMAYARFASGYRPGGPNPTCVLFPAPCQYKPDKTNNYEVGVKGAAFGGLLSFDASVYRIDWKDVQITLNDLFTGAAYFANASRARSQGIELAATSKPLTGLTISGWVAWNDATLTDDLPTNSAAIGFSGDRLPYSSRLSGHLSIDKEFSLTGELAGFVGGAVSYVGDREAEFAVTVDQSRLELPAYTHADLRLGVRRGSWTANLFVNNVTDERGAVSALTSPDTSTAVTYIQPRTIGITVTKEF